MFRKLMGKYSTKSIKPTNKPFSLNRPTPNFDLRLNESAVSRYDSQEYSLFREFLVSGRPIIEYGSGASTIYAARKGVHVFSIETDKIWAEEIRRRVLDSDANVFLVDLGPCGEWGRPLSYEFKNRLPEFFEKPFELVREPTMVFVDGRFRVAAALKAALNTKPGTPIVVDDWTARPHYQILSECLEVVETNGRMAALVAGKNFKTTQANWLFEKFEFVMD